jgi:hypothetical protein
MEGLVSVVLVNPWLAILAILVGIFGVGRLTRAIVHDDFPPSVWLRMTWDKITKDGPWAKLFHCWWCLSQWIALLCIVHFLLTDLALWVLWSWWIIWGSLALGYIATMVVVRDEPSDE